MHCVPRWGTRGPAPLGEARPPSSLPTYRVPLPGLPPLPPPPSEEEVLSRLCSCSLLGLQGTLRSLGWSSCTTKKARNTSSSCQPGLRVCLACEFAGTRTGKRSKITPDLPLCTQGVYPALYSQTGRYCACLRSWQKINCFPTKRSFYAVDQAREPGSRWFQALG